MEEFECFQKAGDVRDTRDAEAGQQSIGACMAARKRSCMRDCRRLSVLRFTNLKRKEWDALALGLERQRVPFCGVAKAFYVKANRGDSRVIEQGHGNLCLRCLRHVSAGHNIGDRQGALLHGEVDGDVGALCKDRYAALNTAASMLVWPDRGPFKCVDEAIAVRPEDGHVACGLHKFGLQICPVRKLRACLRKPAGKTNRSARLERSKLAHDINSCRAIDANEGRINRAIPFS